MEKSMSDHYYTNNPTSKDRPKSFTYKFLDCSLNLTSNSGVFSASQVDFGSDLLIKSICNYRSWEKVKTLDIGCGYGVIGLSLSILGATVTMCDVNNRALELANENSINNHLTTKCIVSDAASDIQDNFHVVVTNPPIRAGKETVYKIFDNAYRLLDDCGELYVVIRKQQGAESAKKHIFDLFGNCEMINRKAGYWILYAVKR